MAEDGLSPAYALHGEGGVIVTQVAVTPVGTSVVLEAEVIGFDADAVYSTAAVANGQTSSLTTCVRQT